MFITCDQKKCKFLEREIHIYLFVTENVMSTNVIMSKNVTFSIEKHTEPKMYLNQIKKSWISEIQI